MPNNKGKKVKRKFKSYQLIWDGKKQKEKEKESSELFSIWSITEHRETSFPWVHLYTHASSSVSHAIWIHKGFDWVKCSLRVSSDPVYLSQLWADNKWQKVNISSLHLPKYSWNYVSYLFACLLSVFSSRARTISLWFSPSPWV